MSRRLISAAIAGALIALPVAAAAQPAGASSRATVDVDALPISLARIQRELRQQEASSRESVLRLDYYVEVYGKPLVIDLFDEADLGGGPAPYGAPSHADMVQMVTPQEFRAPAADLLGPVRLLMDWLGRR